MNAPDARKAAAEFWDRNVWTSIPTRHWTSNPIINEYVDHQIVEPRSARSHLSWWIRKYLPNRPCRELLSLACGGGHAERIALHQGVAEKATGYDISSGSLNLARRNAQAEGLADRTRYEIHDLNEPTFPERRFDVVIAFGCLHHIVNLEGLCAAVAHCLTPGGLFFVSEYVGPNRFQYSDSVLTEVNRVVRTLPAEALTARALIRPDAVALARQDPSEAVRSQDVFDVLREHFDLIDVRNHGGGLLYPLWANVIEPQFFMRLNDPHMISLVSNLCLLDYQLNAVQRVENLFGQYVACPKGQRAGRASTFRPEHGLDRFLEYVQAISDACPRGRARAARAA